MTIMIRLQTALLTVESAYTAILLVGFGGLGLSLYFLTGVFLFAAVIASLFLIVLAFHARLFLINYFLKNCRYPIEFISVLDQLELTEGIEFDPVEDLENGLASYNTEQFLKDNRLRTEIGSKFKYQFCMLEFTEQGLSLNGNVYNWNTISKWSFIKGDEYSNGKVRIALNNMPQLSNTLLLDLNTLNSSRIELMLLLTHFKIKHGRPV